jgi:amino acid transporter
MHIFDALLGKPIATDDDEGERIGSLTGVGVFGLDALASAAYGPEALLTALLPLGASGNAYVAPLMGAIVVLLLLLAFSYTQTITAYPNGGGAYTVAKETLGVRSSLVAAAALSLDYLLNVAVAISAGVGALVSAVPSLLPFTLSLCLLTLATLTLINLRGVRSTGTAVMLPTYAFIICLFAVMIVGIITGAAPAHTTAAHVAATQLAAPLGTASVYWVLLRAFANGCTAMTGVEAVSNGVPLFREPNVVRARRTLLLIVTVLGCLLVGIAFLARRYGIQATPPGQVGYESILSQLTSRVFGRGPLYYLTIGSVLSVLALSANTSFAGFPRVCRMLARDKFLPEPFVHRGRRLAFSHGILVLSGLSALLLIVFGGITEHLIPLFALGALAAFSMSQAGMVGHWRKQGGGRARWHLAINLIGAVATSVTLVIVLIAKFTQGAWLTIPLVGGMIWTFLAVRRHYAFIARVTEPVGTLEAVAADPPLAVVPIRRWDAVSLKALRFAVGASPEVCVVQVLTGDREVDDLTGRWQELAVLPAQRLGITPPRLVVKRSEYRRVFEPLLDFVANLAKENPTRSVLVVVPELVEPRWYQYLLHGQTAALLRLQLRARGGPQVVIANTPWNLRDWIPERRWLQAVRWPRRRRSGVEGPSTARKARSTGT